MPPIRAGGIAAAAAVALALSGPALPLRAQTAPVAGSLQTVAITAARQPLAVDETVAEVTVLTREDLDRETGHTLTEVLAQQPGLQFNSYGGRGKPSALFIRGMEARHTVLLVDGVRVGSATLGLPSLDNLPLGLIDHIEIVRGPLSSLYGSDAAGGVVQVFTRRAMQRDSTHAEFSAGSRGFLETGGGFSARAQDLDLALDVQRTRDRGFSATNANEPYGSYNPDRDGFSQDAASLRAGWQLGADWRVQALVLHASGLTHYDDGPGADAQARLRNDLQSVEAGGRVAGSWRTRIAVSHAIDGYDTRVTASPWTDLGNTGTTQDQVSLENSVDTPLGTLLGVLEKTTQKVTRPVTPFDVSQRNLYAAALALEGRARRLSWQASLRRDHNSQFGNQTTGSLAAAWAFLPAWRAGASWGSSFVAPSFNQLYYPGYGSPGLQPERGHSAELNLRWADAGQEVLLAVYRQRIRGFITSGPLASNVPLAQIDGATLAWQAHFDALAVAASVDHLDPRNATTGAADEGRLLPRRAATAGKASLDWRRGRASYGLTWNATTHRFDDSANTQRLAGYGTLDLRADCALDRDWTVGLRLANAGGKAYETAQGYNQPGRGLFMSLRYATR